MLVRPPVAAQRVARKALDRRAKLPKSKRGGLSSKEAKAQGITSGVEQARKIAAGKDVDILQVRRFFSRFRSTYNKAKRSGKDWEDSKMLQSWDLWGGEPMRKFVMRGTKKKNRCYGARYGARYRQNFSAPRKKKSETWTEYHDRLAAMAFEARQRGATNAAKVLERRAGQVAAKHKLVRKKAGKGGSKGPGTYPWSKCIREARKKGARDPKALCGAIRAKSKKRYPAYWSARERKKNPRAVTKQDVRTLMAGAAMSLVEGMEAKDKDKRLEWFMSAGMYAGAAVAYAELVGGPKMKKETIALAQQIRATAVDFREAKKPKKAKRSNKKPSKRAKPKRDTSAIKRGFMRL